MSNACRGYFGRTSLPSEIGDDRVPEFLCSGIPRTDTYQGQEQFNQSLTESNPGSCCSDSGTAEDPTGAVCYNYLDDLTGNNPTRCLRSDGTRSVVLCTTGVADRGFHCRSSTRPCEPGNYTTAPHLDSTGRAQIV
jgi:hypothetical protein